MSQPTQRRKSTWDDQARSREKVLLEVMAAEPHDSLAYRNARDEVVTMHLPLVEHLARRFRDRGEPHDDLVQVGTVGLIKAVDRFDPDRGVELSTYATPTILGEIKRHFRDKGWSIRVPRRLQEMRAHIGQAQSELSQKSGRQPTVAEIAAYLKVDEDDVLDGLESSQAYSTTSLDAGGGNSDDDSGGSTLSDTLGSDDAALEGVEYRESLKPLLAALSDRERKIIMMRFFENKTQAEIADAVGVSQMHVSRLLTRALAQLRQGLVEDAY